MDRELADTDEAYDADTLKLLGRAFDAAWEDLRQHRLAAEEDRRTRLALIILALARKGRRGECEIKENAVRHMNEKELPLTNATRH